MNPVEHLQVFANGNTTNGFHLLRCQATFRKSRKLLNLSINFVLKLIKFFVGVLLRMR